MPGLAAMQKTENRAFAQMRALEYAALSLIATAMGMLVGFSLDQFLMKKRGKRWQGGNDVV